MKKNVLLLILVSLILVFSLAAFSVLLLGYANKLLAKLGVRELKPKTSLGVSAWKNCLKKLNYDADVAFLGDSLTRDSDFQKAFPNQRIVNLGYSGDTLLGMTQRIPMLQAVSPEKVFVLGGINGLTDHNLEMSLKQYDTLLSTMKESLPEADIYVQSVLPLSKEKERSLFCHNNTIQAFNEQLKKIAEQYQLTYIDLFSSFVKDGHIQPDLTVDGVHLTAAGYKMWTDGVSKYLL